MTVRAVVLSRDVKRVQMMSYPPRVTSRLTRFPRALRFPGPSTLKASPQTVSYGKENDFTSENIVFLKKLQSLPNRNRGTKNIPC